MPLLARIEDDVALDPTVVGVKCATLAQIWRWPDPDRPHLVHGAAVTTSAWELVVEHLGLAADIEAAARGEDEAATRVGAALANGALPAEVRDALRGAADAVGGDAVGLAVRSSAPAEDLADRTFAGQYTTRLDVRGGAAVEDAYRDCLSSAWRPGVQAYRAAMGPARHAMSMAVLVQPMVHGGDGWAGAAVSDGAGGVTVEAVRGLGDALMSGRADPLRWTAAAGEQPDGLLATAVVDWVRRAERRLGHPVEVEFALRPDESRPVVLQLRPHRPAAAQPTSADRWYRPSGEVNGLAVGAGSVRGTVCRLEGPDDADRLVPGGVLVTASTDPAWLPLLGGLGAVVTDHGGLTSHAAIVCRELGLLAVVGCGDATRRLEHGAQVEVRCEGPRGSVVLVG